LATLPERSDRVKHLNHDAGASLFLLGHATQSLFSCALQPALTREQEADLGRPMAAPLERCAELLGVDLATICAAAANLQP
jgi:hypothetical protein